MAKAEYPLAETEYPLAETVAYRVWLDGFESEAKTRTHPVNFWGWAAENYCAEELVPGVCYEFGETLTICVECEGVTKFFNVTPDQEITYDIEEVE